MCRYAISGRGQDTEGGSILLGSAFNFVVQMGTSYQYYKKMATSKFLHKSVGSWKGESKLHLEWLPEDQRVTVCDSKLHIDLDMQKKYATLTYTWVYDGKVEEGSMHVCGSSKQKSSTIGWVDSWHQHGSVLHLKGAEFNDESVKCSGTYPSGDGSPDWGWRIELSLPEENQFLLKMINISPEGKESWAVECFYQRE